MAECGGLASRLPDLVGRSRCLVGKGGQETGTVCVECEGTGRADVEKQDSKDQKEMHQARKSKVERWEAANGSGV